MQGNKTGIEQALASRRDLRPSNQRARCRSSTFSDDSNRNPDASPPMSGPVNNHVVAGYLMVGLTALLAGFAFVQARLLVDDPPDVQPVGFVAAHDHLVVVHAPESSWATYQVSTSLPARVALNEPAAGGVLSLGGQPVVVSRDVMRGGDSVYACTIGLPASLALQVHQGDRVVFEGRLTAPAC